MGGAKALTPADCARELVAAGAVEVRTDPERWFVWTSGRRAPIYCDNRQLISYPAARARVADGLAALVREAFGDAQAVAGAATAGIPHAAWIAERLELPMVYVRGSAKAHGQGRRVEGRLRPGERAVLVEDTISTAGSALEAVAGLRAEGARVVGAVAIFSYGFAQAARALAEADVPWRSLTDYAALLGALELDAAQTATLLKWRDA